MNYISFFSGALGLDLGIEQAGFTPLLYCEKDKHCQNTIQSNKPNIPLIGDIREHSVETIRRAAGLKKDQSVDLVIGGPPCQAFSTAGARKSFDDDRGNVFLKYLDIATELKPKYIVIENVRGLLSAVYSHLHDSEKKKEKGSALKHIKEFLESKNYGVTFNLYNTANFGVPQARERVVIIACKDNVKLPYLIPTNSKNGEFNLPTWNNIQSAISNIPHTKNLDRIEFPEKRLQYIKLLKEGQNWKDLPKDLQREALGKACDLTGGRTGFLRKLSWLKPSPTLVTSPIMPATTLAHPDEARPLSVAEYAKIQQFPDEWIFCGPTIERYRQIGNAVPVGFGAAIANLIKMHNGGEPIAPPQGFKYSRYRNTTELDWTKAFIKNNS